MSTNFSIFVEGEASPDDIVDGPNPAEDDGETNDGNGQSVTGLNDGEEVGDENVANVQRSDRSRSEKESQSSGQQHRRKSFGYGRTSRGRKRKDDGVTRYAFLSCLSPFLFYFSF